MRVDFWSDISVFHSPSPTHFSLFMASPTLESICVHEHPWELTTRPQQLPLFATSSFAFDSIDQGMSIFRKESTGDVYSRYGNPTVAAVEKKLASLAAYGSGRTAKSLLTGSGMSAISTLICGLLKQGDRILTQGNLYGGTTELFVKILSNFGITPVFADLRDADAIIATIQKNPEIKMIFAETPANPTLSCIDLEALGRVGLLCGVYTAVDNTFCTPFSQRPLSLGIDFEIHSTTKFLNGHGNSIAGAIISLHEDEMQEKIWPAMKLMGTTAPPFDAWLLNIGMKTLPLRLRKHAENAEALAAWLEAQPEVLKVNATSLPSHPDHALAARQMDLSCGMLSFELKGGLEAGIRFMNALRFCSLAPTLGDVDTLVLHPATMSHINVAREIREANGITDGLIRLSVGIEDWEDIRDDLDQALKVSE
ncbi:MAG: trans-sulfuration enzyme family protein [Saprospiraceae bacterium]